MKARHVLSIAAATASLLVASSPSYACSFAPRNLTSAQIKQQARDDFSRSSAVIDAEVIEPMKFGADWKPGLTPIAYLRAFRVYKGRVDPDMVPLVYITSCDIGLATKGQKLRVLLSGEGVFRAEQSKNGGGIVDLATYDAEIDRLLGQRKSAGVTHFPGALTVPKQKQNVRYWAEAVRLLFFPIAAGRLSGDPISAGASEWPEVVGSCRCTECSPILRMTALPAHAKSAL